MEYSPMLVIVLWALTPSDCYPLSSNATVEVAKVKEMQGPSMTIQNQEDFIPGYFTFNDGQPFLVEKDPLTGNLNFNIKTTPVKNSHQFFKSSDDYFYEDETSYDTKETIDRKDGDFYGLKNFGQNDIKDSSKSHEDLHKFLNLPVRYSSQGKFPLISSSYANTKVQGHGSSSYSNHKPLSTESPTTFSPTTTTNRLAETSASPSSTAAPTSTTTYRTTTTSTTTTTTTTRPTTTSTSTPAYDYEYIDYYDDKYDTDSSEKPVLNFIPSGMYPSTTFGTTKTTEQPTTQPPTTMTMSTMTTTSRPSTFNTEATTLITTTTPKERVSIVTSLPIDTKEETELDKSPLSIKLSTTTNKIELSTFKTETNSFKDNSTSVILQSEDSTNRVIHVSEKPIENFPELEYGMRLPTSSSNRVTIANKTKIEPVGFGYGIPGATSGGVPGMRPPPWGYGGVPPFQPLGMGHQHPPPPKRPPHPIDYKPHYDGNYVKPGKPHPTPPHTYLTVGSNHPAYHYPPVMNKPPPSFFPEDQIHSSSVNHQSFDNPNMNKHPEKFNGDNFNVVVGNVPKFQSQKVNLSLQNRTEIIRPHDKPMDINVKPIHHVKPPQVQIPFDKPNVRPVMQHGPNRPQSGNSESPQKPSEGFSLVPDNQFVKVPQDQANPSYSLQTSFSIGAPTYEEEKEPSRPMQGIGQVLFPDDEKLETNKRPGPWPPGQPSVLPPQHHPNGPPQPPTHPNSPPSSHHPNNSGGPHPPHHQNGGPQPPHHQSGGSLPPHHQNGGSSQSLHPGSRPSILPQSRPPQRFPPELHSPGAENYPRPPWESHVKHPYIYNPGQKKDPINAPPNYSPPKRAKPQSNSQRQDLPNILPQFRPNAKAGPGEYHGPSHPNHPPFANPPKVREPFDTLQPPPLPRPQFLRVHSNEDIVPEKKMDKKETLPVHLPLVHKRMSGPQSGSRVTPLGLIQERNPPPRSAMLRTDFKEYEKKKDEPVFVVYPSNGGNKLGGHSEGVVVVGTRGSQRPLPPDNLGIEEDVDAFSLGDNNDNFPIPGRDRIDTPILKSKSTPKPHYKPEFPFTLVKPGSVEPPQRIINAGTVDLKKEYTAYSPTISASTEEMLLKEQDAEINIIPYLQDYMPYATKKPLSKPVDSWNVDDKSTLKPLSVTLNTLLGSTNKPIKNHLIVTEKSDSEPERQDFQAPFHASLSEPSQGWSVVTQNAASSDKGSTEHTTSKPTEQTKFDIENFKPELLSGFKPIIPPKFDDDRPTTNAA